MRLRQWPSAAASVTAHRQNLQTLWVLCDNQHQQLHLQLFAALHGTRHFVPAKIQAEAVEEAGCLQLLPFGWLCGVGSTASAHLKHETTGSAAEDCPGDTLSACSEESWGCSRATHLSEQCCSAHRPARQGSCQTPTWRNFWKGSAAFARRVHCVT